MAFKSFSRKNLDLREERDGQFSVPELKIYQVCTLEEAKMYLSKGLERRAISSTSLNNQSSRSHSVF